MDSTHISWLERVLENNNTTTKTTKIQEQHGLMIQILLRRKLEKAGRK
jgi:hypothetical protein